MPTVDHHNQLSLIGGASECVRGDIEVVPQTIGTTIRYVVVDPKAQRYFVLPAEDYYVFSLLDGNHSLEDISGRLKLDYGLAASLATIERFILRLRAAGLLLTAPEPSRRPRPYELLNKVLYLRVKAINPDRLLTFILPYVKMLFTPLFVIVACILIASASGLIVTHKSKLYSDMRVVVKSGLIVWLWLPSLVAAALHECAHGCTCKYWGCRVKEMGLLLIYFCPALYCDVTDAWRLADKKPRLLIMVAGGLFEAFIWAVAVHLWILASNPHIQLVLTLVIMASGAVLLLNFNPLIKLDGYYILSDLLDIPNLRSRSLRFTARTVKAVLCRKAIPRAAMKERIAYLGYAGFAVPFSAYFLCAGTDRLIHTMLHTKNTWAFGVSAIFMTLFISKLAITIAEHIARKRSKQQARA
ncbi:MAG TPA: hypothetical protein VF283_17345 [Bryobacteraceae bacterium]